MKKLKLIAAGLLAGAVLMTGPSAFARGGGADVVKTGSCSASSTWKLKLSEDDGRIEVEYEVDQNKVGDVWNVRLSDNGNLFFKGQRTTQAPSGSFEVRKLTGNQAGTDRIVAKATNTSTSEVCRGVASI
jgi:osmotically-inducible protein OsmY